jgi:hypothetical protein
MLDVDVDEERSVAVKKRVLVGETMVAAVCEIGL